MSSESTHEKALSVDNASSSILFGCFGYLFGFVFSSMFFGMGCLFLWITIISPLIKTQSAKNWHQTPCTIIESKVVQGENPHMLISYTYEFGGRPFESDQFSLSNMNSGDRADKDRRVAQYPVGSEQVCFVNPEFPSEAVLVRDGTGVMWVGLISIPFILVGFIGYLLLFKLRTWKGKLNAYAGNVVQQQHERASVISLGASSSNYDDDDLVETPGPVTLKSENHRWGLFLFLLIFGLIWNSVIGTVFFGEVMDVMRNGWQWSVLFFVPFVLVGIGVMIGVVYCFLALFNPIPSVTLSRQLVPLAGAASIEWTFEGSTRSIRNLKIILRGIESATYRRGTNTTTDTEMFYEQTVFESIEQVDIAEGAVEFVVPTDTMHSFAGGNNEIKWVIVIEGDIPLWPDVSSTFPIRVVPHE